MLHASLLYGAVQFVGGDHVLILNSAADPFVSLAARSLTTGQLLLAEDNIALPSMLLQSFPEHVRHVAYHDYILRCSPAMMDCAVMNLIYQPANSWMFYGLQAAAFALKPLGRLYVAGPKDRGILTIAKRMKDVFGNVETLTISKGQRVLCSRKRADFSFDPASIVSLGVFAESKLDEGTRLLLDGMEVQATDQALDLGCGAGFIGLHIARLASSGEVTMVDASLAAVSAARQAVLQHGLTNVRILPSNGALAVLDQRFSLVATNPPFHQGGIQTLQIAERFIREAAQVLAPKGRFYLVANRFLKYEPTLNACFGRVEEVGGDSRYKVLRGAK
jgi:16S rRNA (guanine1207-N2)-methyltransferase